jgi:hypothetical protein
VCYLKLYLGLGVHVWCGQHAMPYAIENTWHIREICTYMHPFIYSDLGGGVSHVIGKRKFVELVLTFCGVHQFDRLVIYSG